MSTADIVGLVVSIYGVIMAAIWVCAIPQWLNSDQPRTKILARVILLAPVWPVMAVVFGTALMIGMLGELLRDAFPKPVK